MNREKMVAKKHYFAISLLGPKHRNVWILSAVLLLEKWLHGHDAQLQRSWFSSYLCLPQTTLQALSFYHISKEELTALKVFVFCFVKANCCRKVKVTSLSGNHVGNDPLFPGWNFWLFWNFQFPAHFPGHSQIMQEAVRVLMQTENFQQL